MEIARQHDAGMIDYRIPAEAFPGTFGEMARSIKGTFKPVKSGTQKTGFSELSGTFSILKGIVSNSDLAMKAPFLRLGGKGSLNLPDRTVNYQLLPEIVDTATGQGGKEKAGVVVPLLITGSMDDPSITPDVKGLIKDAIKNPEKVKANIKNAKEMLKLPKTKEKLKELKGLLR
jgi:hypothetical protein